MSRGDAILLRRALESAHPDLTFRVYDYGIVQGWGVKCEGTVAAVARLESEVEGKL